MDSDVSPVSESDVLEGSVSSTVAGGGGAPQRLRIHDCETKAADGT